MAKLTSMWPSCLVVVLLATICLWIFDHLEPQPFRFLKISSHQQRLWDDLQLQYSYVLDVCQIHDNDDSLSTLRDQFERYENDRTIFLKTVQTDMPNALGTKDCSKFVHSDRLAIKQLTSISRSLSAMCDTKPEQILSATIRQDLLKRTASATSRFSYRVREVVRKLWYRPWKGIKSLVRFDTTGVNMRQIHEDAGLTMLVMRKCAADVKAMDRALEVFLQSLKETAGPHEDLVAHLATTSKTWEEPVAASGGRCTEEHLEATKRYHDGLTKMIMQYDHCLIAGC